jgi:hypothetical protein
MQDYKNVQGAVDKLLNVSSFVKRKKRKETDKKKELFVQMINHLEQAISRSNIAYVDLEMDMSRYDEKFYVIIDILLYMGFGPECSELLSYYLWDRIMPDGAVVPLYDEQGGEIVLNSAYDLWDLVCKVNPKVGQ